MISANGNMYDHASSFETNGFIDWRQRAKYTIGDTVYIYCTRPFKRVMYKCEVIEHSLAFSECIDDKDFWIDANEYEKSKTGLYARLKLIEQVDTNRLSLDSLIENGLKAAPQGPVKVSEELHKYIERYFNDFYADGYFTDVNDEDGYHEGHVRSIKVNKYERSSIARRKCIEHNGIRCVVCGLNFEEKYGTLGKGFIHIHHLRPLHTIKKDYIIDYKKDLIPVCPNCHAMIHRIPSGETMSIEQIKTVLITSTNNTATIKDSTTKAQRHISSQKNHNKKYVGQRVIHSNQKFGAGIVTNESDTTISISFDNGLKAMFTKESFDKKLLTFEKQ